MYFLYLIQSWNCLLLYVDLFSHIFYVTLIHWILTTNGKQYTKNHLLFFFKPEIVLAVCRLFSAWMLYDFELHWTTNGATKEENVFFIFDSKLKLLFAVCRLVFAYILCDFELHWPLTTKGKPYTKTIFLFLIQTWNCFSCM